MAFIGLVLFIYGDMTGEALDSSWRRHDWWGGRPDGGCRMVVVASRGWGINSEPMKAYHLPRVMAFGLDFPAAVPKPRCPCG